MEFIKGLFNYNNASTVCGLTDELNILYMYNYFIEHDDNVLVLTNSLYDANKLFQKFKTYTDNVCLFPMDDFLSSVALAISPDLKITRLNTLEEIKNNKKSIIVTNLMGYLRFLPNVKESSKLNISIKKGDSINREELLERLNQFGYTRDSLVSSTGEYAVRGYIIDIFPIENAHPIRLEFFGDEVDSIRVFNEDTQLSINEVTSINVLPFDEVIENDKSSLVDYLNNPCVFFIDKRQILNGYNKILNDIKEYNEYKSIDLAYRYMFTLDEINVDKYINIETLSNVENSDSYNSRPIVKFNGNYERFVDFVISELNHNIVILFLSKQSQIDLVTPLFDNISIGTCLPNKVNIINKKINSGFIFKGYTVISEYDIDDIKVASTYKNTYKIGRKIKDFSELHSGDYVVHSAHGIGIYNGIVPLKKGNLIRDYIQINYAHNDKVYIPVEKIDTIYKYQEADGIVPKVNSLNSSSWAKTKMKVRNRIKDISEELIKLYAARNSIIGEKYRNYPEEEIFASEFEYIPTSDQDKCINEILKDLNNPKPMDRLLCGDVGFGKTEVAFRAIFKTVMNGHQVCYLCPTTLLSRQQYKNALERFKNHPINIALLNRFTSAKETKRIIEDVKEGKIDIVFGTHKLFNKEIKYKDLGLLIIDEEQRFGVTHKEKIKELKNDVNVLTLSATPIPRTLKMSMSGLRDLSIIDTAPVNRYPVQTYVLEENDVLVKDAIYKELSRNGQVFILYNKVESIEDEVTKIKSLVPEAKIVMAHGQMEKNKLEDVVTSFVNGDYDIMVCTTIIETGIDIPNVNTLIIKDAENFGLSQLYQLRGRVGRSDKIAYAYLMYKPQKVLTETAIKRLKSIKDFTELGSGYKIAMRDLSIRGAGDLLGSEQAGFIDTVGLELYTQMVNDEIKRLNGEEVLEDENNNPLIEVQNHISDEYVSEESIKIEIHKMINAIKDAASLEQIKKEIIDRFGNITDDMDVYMHEEWFEKLAQQLGIKNVRQSNSLLEIELPEDISNMIEGDKLFLIVYNINPKFRLSYRMKKIMIALPLINLDKHFIYYSVKLLDEINNMVKDRNL